MTRERNKSRLNGFLDAGSHLEGTLRFEDTFRVEGRLTGTVESEGSLYVGERGRVEGEIRVTRLYVSGTVDGEVETSERVEVAPGGRLLGTVTSPCLVIEEGAVFQGRSEMIDQEGAAGKVAALRR
ncbi:MAG: polymer-forming cytoskeletal protein [Thermoanaerobaculia bacterium]|nr:polymer-forming cytoskeletal protein [Thermoanaerobaculia bacterium]